MEILSSELASPLLALSNDLAGAVERAGRAVVAVNARQQLSSSGVHWRQGVIVTAEHAVKRDEEITITLPDGRTVPAALAGRDPGTDLAVLKLEGVEFPTAELADAASLRVGHVVLALGRSAEGGLGASLGVISTLSGPWRGRNIDQLVRLDLTLYPGFSGGPLVDAHGRVVGMNTSGLSRTMGLSVPASTVNRVADTLLAKGRVARGYLGLGMHPVRLPDAFKSKLKLTGSGGLIVITVEPDGPAERAGMLIGDVLVKLDGTPVGDTDDLQAILGPDSVGKTVCASIVRGGASAGLMVTVGERSRRER